MSDESKSKPSGSDWKMPDPVFRTSEGSTPNPAKSYIGPDDIDTESPNSDEYDAGAIDTESPNLGDLDAADSVSTSQQEIVEDTAAIYEEKPPNSASSEPKTQKSKSGCASSILMVFGMVAFFAIALLVSVVYFLFYFKPTETGTF